MEVLDLYDDNGNKLNEEIIRGNKPELGKNIMLSIVFIKDKNGKYLVQKTSKEKGGKFATTGGHVIKGETGIITIIREIKEELGLNIKKEELVFINKLKYPTKQCIFNIYALNIDSSIMDNIELQESEVESVVLMDKKEIMKEIAKGNFLESHAYIFEKNIY